MCIRDRFTIIDGIRGRGWLAGVSMAVGSNSNSGWVEGETKIFIDGEKYPTVNYTGTEDYFGCLLYTSRCV